MAKDRSISVLTPGVDSGADADFHALPDVVYDRDPNWVRPSPAAARAALDRADFAGRQLPLLACRGERPAARLVARVTADLRHDEPGPVGTIGLFESLNDQEAATALFSRAMAWFRDRGVRRVIGPMDGDTWHRYRLNLGPWDTRPFLLEPYNPQYYPELWHAFGFQPLAGYYSKRVAAVEKVLPRMEPFLRRVERNGFTFRAFDVTRFDAELEVLYDLSCAIFADNIFYSPIPPDEFRALYAGSRSLIVPGLVWFSLDTSAMPNGFVFSLPDCFEAVRAMRGRHGLTARLRFLWLRRRADALNIKTVGVIPRDQRTGLGPALMYKAFAAGHACGFHHANMCLIHEDNVSGRLDGGEGVVSRRYALYQYRL